MEKLFQLFDSIEPLQPGLKDYIQSNLQRREVHKREILLQEGKIAKHIYFIETGLVRCYQNWDDKDTTVWIMKENDLFVSVGSFFSQTPSFDNIEALEDSIVHGLTSDQLQYAYKHWPQFNLHRAVILEKYYTLAEIRGNLRHKPAPLAFEYLMKEQRDLLNRVPDKYLASYLGISQATFSYEKNRYLREK